MTRLNELYNKDIVPQMMKDFNYRNVMQVPKVEKIVINMGLGEAIQNVKILDSAADNTNGGNKLQDCRNCIVGRVPG